MNAAEMSLAKQMLDEFLNEDLSLQQIAARHRVGKSTAERRIKALLTLLGGDLKMVPVASRLCLPALKAHADAVMDAALRCPAPEGKGTAILGSDDIDKGVACLRRCSARPRRDVAMLVMLFATGVKPVEMARMRVGDVLTPDSLIRHTARLSFPREPTAEDGGSSRLLPLTGPRVQETLRDYLAERAAAMRHGGGAGLDGLDHAASLFLTDGGEPFRTWVRGSNGVVFCPRIFEVLSAIFRLAGWPGVRPSVARRTFTGRLVAGGATVDEVQSLLGLRTARTARRLVAKAHGGRNLAAPRRQ